MRATTHYRRPLARVAVALALLCTAGSAPAWAQRQSAPRQAPKWTLELVGGGSFGPPPSGGSTVALPAGATFNTQGGFPTRANPSWYFGDGAALFNDVQAQFASRFGIQFPRITPLDGVLTSAGLERPSSASFGVRLTRRLTPRFSLELGVQRTQGTLQLSSDALDGIETTRASFESALRGLLGTIPLTGLQVTSEAEVPDSESSSQMALTGVLNIALTQHGRLATHVSAGAGYVTNSGSPLEVRLRGNYQFQAFDLSRHNESDSIVVHFDGGESTLVGIIGGGITYDVAARHGLRLDLRLHAGSNKTRTTLEAAADVRKSTPATSLSSFTTPSVQFSNLTGVNSSLNGRLPVQDTFTGSGLEMRMHFTVGYFFRF